MAIKENKRNLLAVLQERYRKTHPRSADYFKKTSRFLIDGGSHTLRLFPPFPFYDKEACGSMIKDLDGFTYIDFWQGHFSNILGHNSPAVIQELRQSLQKNQGLITGFPGLHQEKLAELILSRLPAECIRFTTSGSLASMYAVMLAKAYTGRRIVLKVGGGWHGAHPYGLKGITTFKKMGLESLESAGLPESIEFEVVVSEFNNIEDLVKKFERFGDEIACLIVEPFMGAGGFIFADKEYLKKARQLTQRYKSLLILDEVISGFRFHAGALQSNYGIQADLTVLGKVIGGGMPVSAVAGKRDILELCSREAPADKKVKFEGGTFSAHPLAMKAGIACISHLIENEQTIYPYLGKQGNLVRSEVEKIFRFYGFKVHCTGNPPSFSLKVNSSMVGIHFLLKDLVTLNSPQQVFNPEISDYSLREEIFRFSMLEKGFYVFHGFGAISTAHSEKEIQHAIDAVELIAKKWKEMNLSFD